MEDVVKPRPLCHAMFHDFYAGRRVAITGHTGFKGSWLAFWLSRLGARVHGFSLPPPTQPSLHEVLGPSSLASSTQGDIRDLPAVSQWLAHTRPEVVFHLAAQPLVRLSYREPLDTLTSCVVGTAHVLEAARPLGPATRVVVVTTDKVYENVGWDHGYRESDAMGGHDPYSASKAAADVVAQAWRRSFFPPGRVATVRAGNVIGGGDYAEDRVLPDAVRALMLGTDLVLRHPGFTRPWQHVFDCLAGYLDVGARLDGAKDFPEAFNFGPGPDGNRTVAELVEAFNRHWPGTWRREGTATHLVEAGRLNLSIDRACTRLGWRPAWPFGRAVQATAEWYRARHGGSGADMVRFSGEQLDAFVGDARTAGAGWAA